jgi:hypothetical protein
MTMAGDSKIQDPTVELPDENFLAVTPPYGLNAVVGGELVLTGGAGNSPLGIPVFFDRETTVNSIKIHNGYEVFDDSYVIQIYYAKHDQTNNAAVGVAAQRLDTGTIDLSTIVAGSFLEVTLNTANNRVPANARLVLKFTSAGGALSVGSGYMFVVRGRTRLIA